jgi:MFS family permease
MRRTRLAFMITLNTLSSLGVGLLGPIYPIFVLNRFSASMLDIGILLTIFGLSSAIFKAPAGKLVDTYGEKTVFLAGVILGAVCSFAYIFVFDLVFLYLIEFFSGVSYAFQEPARLSLVVEIGSRRGKGLIIGISQSAYDIAGSLAALIAVAIASNFGFESVFFACFGFQTLTGLLVLKSNLSTC